MIRFIQIALLFAVMIPFGWVVRHGVDSMTPYWRDMAFAALVGFCVCYGLWHWTDRQRAGGAKRGD